MVRCCSGNLCLWPQAYGYTLDKCKCSQCHQGVHEICSNHIGVDPAVAVGVYICRACEPPRPQKDPPPSNEKVQEQAAYDEPPASANKPPPSSTNKPAASTKKPAASTNKKRRRPAASANKKAPTSSKKKNASSSSDDPTKGRRTKNWQPSETVSLLKIVREVLPSDDKEWEEVNERFLSRNYLEEGDDAPVREYAVGSTHLKKRFNSWYKVVKYSAEGGGSGNEVMSDHSKKARAIQDLIVAKEEIGISNKTSDDLDEEGGSGDDDDDDDEVPGRKAVEARREVKIARKIISQKKKSPVDKLAISLSKIAKVVSMHLDNVKTTPRPGATADQSQIAAVAAVAAAEAVAAQMQQQQAAFLATMQINITTFLNQLLASRRDQNLDTGGQE
jgi:hypothetical protein